MSKHRMRIRAWTFVPLVCAAVCMDATARAGETKSELDGLLEMTTEGAADAAAVKKMLDLAEQQGRPRAASAAFTAYLTKHPKPAQDLLLKAADLAALGVHQEHRRRRAAERPQPALDPVAPPPAGFVRVRDLLCADVCRDLGVGRRERTGKLFLAVGQAAEAHRDMKHLVHDHQRLAFADVQDAGEHADQRQHAGTEATPWRVLRQRRVDARPAPRAGARRADVFGHVDLDRRHVDNLVTHGILAAVEDTTPCAKICDAVARPVVKGDRRSRALRIGDREDLAILQVVSRGEFAAAGIVRKVQKTHRYVLTSKGHLLTAALFAAREANIKKLLTQAA